MFLFKLDRDSRIVEVSSGEFVACWKEFYDEVTYPTEEYEKNLNLGGFLTDQNVAALLRWKLGFLPVEERHELVNKLALKVSKKLELLNQFRSLETVTKEQFLTFWEVCLGLAREVNRHFVIGTFLIHVARPLEYPMTDQHTLRAHYFIEHGEVIDSTRKLETYEYYKIFLAFSHKFHELSRCAQRDVDKALWSFGKRLKQTIREHPEVMSTLH